MVTMTDSLHAAVLLLVLVFPQLRLCFPYTLDYLHKNDTVAFHDKGPCLKSLVLLYGMNRMEMTSRKIFSVCAGRKDDLT